MTGGEGVGIQTSPSGLTTYFTLDFVWVRYPLFGGSTSHRNTSPSVDDRVSRGVVTSLYVWEFEKVEYR